PTRTCRPRSASAAGARATCSGRGWASRWPVSPCSTRPGRAFGREPGIIGAMRDDVDAGFGPAWSASRARVPEATLAEWLGFAAGAGGHFRRAPGGEPKPARSFVTVADRAIEREIRSRIHDRWPDHGLVGEEY